MRIQMAETDDAVAACHPVMFQLRPHIAADGFVARVRRQQQSGYLLAFLEDQGIVRAVAGFR